MRMRFGALFLAIAIMAAFCVLGPGNAQTYFPPRGGSGGGVSNTAANVWTGLQTFAHQKFAIRDSADNNKITIESAADNAADRVLQIPALSGNGVLVLETATQTLANKTLTSPIINTPTFGAALSIANGGTNNASLGLSALSLVTGDGSKLVQTAAGTANQLFRVNNGGTAITPVTLAAGSNITITQNANDITIASTGGGGGSLPANGNPGNVLTDDGSAWVSEPPSALSEKRTGRWEQLTNVATTFNAIGLPTAAHTGNSAATANDADGCCIQSTSAATTGSDFGWTSAANFWCRYDGISEFIFVIKTGSSSDLTNSRLWVGLYNGTFGSIFGTDTPHSNGVQCIAVRYNPGVDGTAFFRTVSSGASNTTVNVSTVAVAPATKYVIRFKKIGSNVQMWINGTLAGTHNTNMPDANATMAPIVGGETTENAAKIIKVYGVKGAAA